MNKKGKGISKGFGAMLILLVAIMIFMEFAVPKLFTEQAEKNAFPKLDQQYVKLFVRNAESGDYSEKEISKEDAESLMKYINFDGRNWDSGTKPDGDKYMIQCNDDQSFFFAPQIDSIGAMKLDLWFVNNTEEGEKAYTSSMTGGIAESVYKILSK